MKLIQISSKHYKFLYDLLSERKQFENISHKKLPSYNNHVKFIKSKPYSKWLLIECKEKIIGSVYLSKNNEIAIWIKKGIKDYKMKIRKKVLEEIITKFKKVHGNKYDYSKINYRGNHKDIDIYCKKCDRYFAQRPSVHKRGGGCKVCSSKEGKYHFKKTKEEFISGASIKHRNKYDYSKVIYNNDRSKVIIICSEHGKIKQSAGEHYRGKVPYCCSPSKPVMLEEWKERANKKHFYHYRYDKVGETYKNKDSIVTIICPKHGDFYKHAGTHIGKQRPGGCYFCKTSRGEIIVKKILNKNKINFTYQKTFPGMKYINELECDFYLKDFNTVIEYNGEQHYKSNDFFGGINGFIEQQKRDKIKYEYLEKMKIKLIIVKYNISENDVESYILNKLNSK